MHMYTLFLSRLFLTYISLMSPLDMSTKETPYSDG